MMRPIVPQYVMVRDVAGQAAISAAAVEHADAALAAGCVVQAGVRSHPHAPDVMIVLSPDDGTQPLALQFPMPKLRPQLERFMEARAIVLKLEQPGDGPRADGLVVQPMAVVPLHDEGVAAIAEALDMWAARLRGESTAR